jgi:hypothetical protein
MAEKKITSMIWNRKIKDHSFFLKFHGRFGSNLINTMRRHTYFACISLKYKYSVSDRPKTESIMPSRNIRKY